MEALMRVPAGMQGQAAASALSITIKSLSCRLRPDAEKLTAPVRSLAIPQ
jgi:hypothetical protein